MSVLGWSIRASTRRAPRPARARGSPSTIRPGRDRCIPASRAPPPRPSAGPGTPRRSAAPPHPPPGGSSPPGPGHPPGPPGAPPPAPAPGRTSAPRDSSADRRDFSPSDLGLRLRRHRPVPLPGDPHRHRQAEDRAGDQQGRERRRRRQRDPVLRRRTSAAGTTPTAGTPPPGRRRGSAARRGRTRWPTRTPRPRSFSSAFITIQSRSPRTSAVNLRRLDRPAPPRSTPGESPESDSRVDGFGGSSSLIRRRISA